MTAAELLERLAQRPSLLNIWGYERFMVAQQRYQFDRALLLDAFAACFESFNPQIDESISIDNDEYERLCQEARDCEAALRTIVTELRSNP